MNDANIRLILKVCELYYIENKTQNEIAKSLNISRPHVSRLLTKAKNDKIVNISINNPLGEKNEYEELLRNKFNIKEALIIDYPSTEENGFYKLMAKEIDEVFKRYVKNNGIVAVSTGNTLTKLSEHILPINKKNVTVVAAGGSINLFNLNWQGNKLLTNIANAWNCSSVALSAPVYVSRAETKNALLKETEIKSSFDLAKKADVLLTSFGPFFKEKSDAHTNYPLTKEELLELKNKNCKAICCGSFIDVNGKEINCACKKKNLNLMLNEFKPSVTIIAIAFGKEKIEAITAGLKTKKIGVFITDLQTAKNLINHKK